MFESVDFVCPLCGMTCGWNEKKQVYDAVEVEAERETAKRYAHRSCVEKAEQR